MESTVLDNYDQRQPSKVVSDFRGEQRFTKERRFVTLKMAEYCGKKGENRVDEHIAIRILTRVFDFILLNILWVLCSLPLITVGTSITALYTVMMRIVVDEEAYIISDFFRAFKDNLKKSTIVWMLLLSVGAVIGINLRFWSNFSGIMEMVGWFISGVAMIFFAVELIFVFPIIAKFENSIGNHLKNGILIPIMKLPQALVVILMTGVCIFLTLLNVKTIMVGAVIWTSFGVSLLTYANSIIIRQMFLPFMENVEGEVNSLEEIHFL